MMTKRKIVLIAVSVIFMILVVFCIYYIEGENSPTVTVLFGAESDYENDVVFHKISSKCSDDGSLYIVIPEYVFQNNVVLSASSGHTCIDGEPIQCISDLKPYSQGVHTLTVGKGFLSKKYPLYIMQSNPIASVFIDTATGSCNGILNDIRHNEPVSVFIYNDKGERQLLSSDCNPYLKGHGNITWSYDKKSFTLSIRTPEELLGMSASAKWVLQANAMDVTEIRNRIAYDFARELGVAWTPECTFVELYINSEYSGLYLLCEHLDKYSFSPDGIDNENIILCNLEPRDRWSKMSNPFMTKLGYATDIVIPAECSNEQIQRITERVARLEKKLTQIGTSSDCRVFEDELDIDSWARKYLIDEILMNQDSGLASFYYYWDKSETDTSPIKGDIIWDYDISMGTSQWISNPRCLYAINRISNIKEQDTWYAFFYRDRAFRDKVCELYEKEARPAIESMINNRIDLYMEDIDAALDIDHLVWKSNYERSKDNYDAEALKTFLSERMKFLDSLWIEKEEYVVVSCSASNSEFRRFFYVRPGEQLGLDTLKRYFGDDIEGCVYKKSKEPFDYNQPVNEDIELLVTMKDSEAKSFLQLLYQKRNALLGFILMALGALGIILLVFDIRRINRTGERHE